DGSRKVLGMAPQHAPADIRDIPVATTDTVAGPTLAQAPPPAATADRHPDAHPPAAHPAAPRAPAAPAPRARMELAADIVGVAPLESLASVVVHRSGNLTGDVSFKWWTESGTAKPKRDFSPVAGRVEHIGSGKSAVALLIPVVADAARKQEK